MVLMVALSSEVHKHHLQVSSPTLLDSVCLLPSYVEPEDKRANCETWQQIKLEVVHVRTCMKVVPVATFVQKIR